MSEVTEESINARNEEAPEFLTMYLERISWGELLSKEQERELARRVRRGDERAGRRLTEKNLRLVVKVAGRYRGYGLPFEDLIQEGNVGLLRAVEKFDPEKGCRFSTYATWWIRQAVVKAVADKGRIIRLPVHTGEKVRKVRRTAAELSAGLGREPTDEEIAECLGWTPGKLREVKATMPDAASFDRPLSGEQGGPERGYFVEDERLSNVPDAEIGEMERAWLEGALERLPEVPHRVLIRRYGLDGFDPATLAELSSELSLSRERTRQLQREAEHALRCAFRRRGEMSCRATA